MKKFTLLSLILTGFLTIPWRGYSGGQPINPPPTTSHLTIAARAIEKSLVTIAWPSTSGTSAVLEHLNTVANGSGLIESLAVPTNVASFNVASFSVLPSPSCGHQFRLVITGPGGTVSQTITEGDLSGSCFI